MDLRQLRYFCAVAHHGNFGRAAIELRVTQPALSRQIQLLEDTLGVRLLHRHRRGADLTPEGQLLQARAEFVIRQVEQTQSDLRARRDEASGPVSVGFSAMAARILAPPLAAELGRRCPAVSLRMIEAFAPGLHGMLLEGQLDLALLLHPWPPSGLLVTSAVEETICLVGPRGHPLLQQDTLRFADCARLPLILTGIPRAGVLLEVERASARLGIHIAPRAEVNTVGIALGMVRAGLGFTFHVAACAAGDEELAAVPIRGMRVRRAVGRAAGRPASRAVLEAERTLKGAIKAAIASGAWPGARVVDAVPGRAKVIATRQDR